MPSATSRPYVTKLNLVHSVAFPMSDRLPTLVIVGRPNVGKSTMFNRIVGRRIAVVEDTPGVTRDRLYSEVEFGKYKFNLVDTGGILFGDEDPLVEQIRTQAEVAMAEADSILFVVDAIDGLHSADWDLANRLRGFKRPIYIVANKADNQDRVDASAEFYELGLGEVFAVSSLQDKGFDRMLGEVLEGFPKRKEGEDRAPDEVRLALIGRPNVGKSSMLNALTGEERVIVSNIPGTTRDAIDTQIDFKGRKVRLIDTAGIRRRGKYQGSMEYYMVLRAQSAIERADCAVLIVDGQEGLTDGDKRVAKFSHDAGRPLVIVVNKWDLVEPPDGNIGKKSDEKRAFLKVIENELPEMSYAPIRFASALEEEGMDALMKCVFQCVESWSVRIPTGPLNRLVQDAVFEKPLTRKGLNFKIKYVTQPQTQPPTFVMFCNNPDLFHFSYQRYIENRIRKAFPLTGTPIRIVSRKSAERE